MTGTFPGSPLRCFAQRQRHRESIRHILDSLREDYGEIYWYFTSLRSRSRVLVVYDSEAAYGILKDESWIFSKALEPWENHHKSLNPWERLLGDGVWLADGMHHHKRAAAFLDRLYSEDCWSSLDESLHLMLSSFQLRDPDFKLDGFLTYLLQELLRIYFGLRIDDDSTVRLRSCFDAVWRSYGRNVGCPFRFQNPRLNHRLMIEIDQLRDVMLRKLNERLVDNVDMPQKARVTRTSLAEVDEIMVFTFSAVQKLSVLLHSVLTQSSSISEELLPLISEEFNRPLTAEDDDQWESQCPKTFLELNRLYPDLNAPIPLVKRLSVSDALIRGLEVVETTEIWIPTWASSNQFMFSKGCYKCPAQRFSLFVAARFIQFLACARLGNIRETALPDLPS